MPNYDPAVNQPNLYHFLEILNEYVRNANLSEKAYRVILNSKVKGAALDTILQNKNRPLKKILTLLKLRFAGSSWPNSLFYEKELDDFSRQPGENLHSTMARYENILRNLHSKLPPNELNNLVEKDMRHAVKRFCDINARTQLHRMEVLASRNGETYDYATRLSILALEEKLANKDQVPTYGPYLNNVSLASKQVEDKEMEELTNLFCSAFGMKREREGDDNEAAPRAKSPRQDSQNVFRDREKARKFLENLQSGRTPSPSTSPNSSPEEKLQRSPFQRPKSERQYSGGRSNFQSNKFAGQKPGFEGQHHDFQGQRQEKNFGPPKQERPMYKRPPQVPRTDGRLPFQQQWQKKGYQDSRPRRPYQSSYQDFEPNISYPKISPLNDFQNDGYQYFRTKEYSQEIPNIFQPGYSGSRGRGRSYGNSYGNVSYRGRTSYPRGYGRQDNRKFHQDPNIVRQTLRLDHDRFSQNLSLERMCQSCDPNVLPPHSLRDCPTYR